MIILQINVGTLRVRIKVYMRVAYDCISRISPVGMVEIVFISTPNGEGIRYVFNEYNGRRKIWKEEKKKNKKHCQNHKRFQ